METFDASLAPPSTLQMPLSVSRKMEVEFEEDFLKGLEDIDWDADWDEIE